MGAFSFELRSSLLDDWITWSDCRSTGPADLVTREDDHYTSVEKPQSIILFRLCLLYVVHAVMVDGEVGHNRKRKTKVLTRITTPKGIELSTRTNTSGSVDTIEAKKPE